MNVVDRWHQTMESRNPARLDELLADDVVFYSPVVHTPQVGKAITRMYLVAAMMTLYNESFEYRRQTVGDDNAVLEFSVTIDDIVVNGVDWFSWNRDEQIDEFKVWLRPLKAVNLIHQKMSEMLAALGTGSPGGKSA